MRKKVAWNFTRPNGGVVAFNVDSLADFMLATGEFFDPITRIPFSDDSLREIDLAVTKAGLQKGSVLEAKNNPQNYAESRFRRDALEGLERCAGEVVAEMLTLVEMNDPHLAQMQLLMASLPAFADY